MERRWLVVLILMLLRFTQSKVISFLTVPFAFLGLQVRNNCRHHFLSSKALKAAYDAVTWAATQLAVSYTVAPFLMLAVEPAVSLYK